MELDSLTLTEQ